MIESTIIGLDVAKQLFQTASMIVCCITPMSDEMIETAAR